MTTGKALDGKPYAGNPHVRFDEGEAASCTAEASLRRVHCRRQPEAMTRPQVALRSEVARGLRTSGCATSRRGSLLYIIGAAVAALCMAHSAAAGTAVWASDAGGDITVGSNWVGGTAPSAGDFLDFSAITSAQTLTGSFSDDRVFSGLCLKDQGNKNNLITLNGTLNLQNLTNACNLIVGSAGTLAISGDLVWQNSTISKLSNDTASILHYNKGTVTVGGNIVAIVDSGVANWQTVYQYWTGNQSPYNPIRTGGIVYKNNNNALAFYFSEGYNSANRKSGEFVIGANGISFDSTRDNQDVKYTVISTQNDADCTFHSSADWTFGTSGRSNTTQGDLHCDNAMVQFDTSDYDGATAGHEITMEGRIYAPSTSGTSVNVTGNGTFTLATVEGNGLEGTRISNTLAVADTATLQIELRDCECQPRVRDDARTARHL